MAGVEMRRMSLPCSDAKRCEEVIGEQQHVRLPLAQRRNEDREDVEPVEQVLAERALRDRLLQVLVRRGDQAHVDLDAARCRRAARTRAPAARAAA